MTQVDIFCESLTYRAGGLALLMHHRLPLIPLLLGDIRFWEISEWGVGVPWGLVVLPRLVIDVLGLEQHGLQVVLNNQSGGDIVDLPWGHVLSFVFCHLIFITVYISLKLCI